MNMRNFWTAGLPLAVVATLGATTGLAAQAVGTAGIPSVTLDQAVQLTLENSPTMVQARGQVRTTGASQLSAYGNFLPSVSLSSGANKQSTNRYDPATGISAAGSASSYNAGLSASLTLFNGGRNTSSVRQANAQNSAADANLIQQQYQVTLTAKTAFFNVLRDGELVTVAEAQLAQAQQGLDAANERLKVGSATRSDVLRAQLSVTQAKQSLLQAQTNLSTDQFRLGRLVGRSGPVTATPPASLEPSPLAMPDDQLTPLVEAQAPAVVTAQADLKAAHASVVSARSQYFPSLGVSSGYNWNNAATGLRNGNTSWRLGLSISYPLFNGFTREQQVESANVQADNAEATLTDARLNARAQLEADLASVRQSEQQIQYSQEAVQSAEEDLRVQQERYRLGAGTMLDRLTSQASLVQAQTNAVNARYDYQIAKAQLEALVGRDL